MVSALDVSVLTRVRSIIFSLDVVTTIAIYFLPKLLAGLKPAIPMLANDTRRGSIRGRSRSEDSSDIGQFSYHGAGRRGGTRGGFQRQESLRFETPPTNRFLRFLTGISNITHFEQDDTSAHAIDGIHNAETNGEENVGESDSPPPPSKTADGEAQSSPSSQASFNDDGSSQTFACETVSHADKDQESGLIAEQKETIALLRDEIIRLRRRLAMKEKSESDGSAETLKT